VGAKEISNKSEISKKENVVIIGGGVGGLTAGIYLARLGIKPIIIEGEKNSLITKSPSVENWPGETKISGFELIEKLREQALLNGAIIKKAKVIEVEFSKRPFKIISRDIFNENIEEIWAENCIIATGITLKRLNVLGEEKYFGNGVYTCALCDGAIFKGKKVAVIGSGNTAILDALYLSNLSKKVLLILRGKSFRKGVDRKNLKKLVKRDNVEIIYKSNVISFRGDENELNEIEIKKEGKVKRISIDGVFLAIGGTPNSEIFKEELELDEKGYIVLKNGKETSKKGVFAIGDVVNREKQAIFAAADGAEVALVLGKYLEDEILRKDEKIIDGIEKESKIVEIESFLQLEEELEKSKIPLLLEFYSPFCGPCRKIAPFLEKSAEELCGVVKILKINVSKQSNLAKKYNIKKMPTVIFLDSKKIVKYKKIGTFDILEFLKELSKSSKERI
jgi:thioredoxin reductase (NADPH)